MNDYDPKNIKKVKISEIRSAEWNPKDRDTKEYKKVLRSIGLNGLMTPLFVRNDNGYELVDGHSRLEAAKELGYSEVYVYDLGEISEAEAKALALWFSVQVPFDEVMLAPLAIELDRVGIELPYDEKELAKFDEMVSFDLSTAFEDEEPIPEPEAEENPDKMKNYKIKLPAEVYPEVLERIRVVQSAEDVNMGRAFELILEAGAVNSTES